MANGGANSSLTEQDLTRLHRMVDSLLTRVRNQRNILRQRGMDLPKGTIQNLEQIFANLEEVGIRIIEQNDELERLRMLAGTTSLLNSSLDLDKTLASVMDTVLKLTNAKRGYIMLRNPNTNEMELRVARGIDEKDLDDSSLLISRTVVDQVLATGEPIVTTDAQSDDRFANGQSIVDFNLRSILCVPLIIKGSVEGVVYADNNIRDSMFGNKELQLLFAVASQSALAIENATLFEQVRNALDQITEFKTLLDNILASIASGVITTDAADTITTYSVGAEHILGVPHDATYGQTLADAVPAIYTQVKEVLDRVRSLNESITLDTEAEIRPTERRSLNLRLSPLKDANNAIQGVALVVDDLTDLKRRDAMLQAVRRYLPPAMVDDIGSIDSIALGGERRHVTVLYVDVLPQMGYMAQLQARQFMDLLNIYLTVGTEAIHRHNGLIDKYMGSEIMGLFNTQLNPSETHYWDALLAAVEMMKDFRELYERMGENLQTPYYRMGIHTGVATLGNVGGRTRREFSVIGDTVNLSHRLLENAQFGELIISKDTYLNCQDQLSSLEYVEVVSGGTIQVKGKMESTEIFQVRRLD